MIFKRILITAVFLLILSNILMNGSDIAAIYKGPAKYPVFNRIDFSNYYTTSRMLAEKGGGIYNSQSFTSYAGKTGKTDVNPDLINYPPLHYTILIPLSRLDYNIAWSVWLIINNIFLAASCFLISITFLKDSPVKTRVIAFILLLAFSFFSASYIDNMGHGQVNAELLFLLSLCFYLYTALQGGKLQFLAGIPLGLSIAVKGLPAPVALYFLVKKDWKTLGTIIISNFLFTILPGFIFGFDLIREYASVKSRYFFFCSGVEDSSSYNFWSFLIPSSTSAPQALYAATSILLLGFSLWILAREKESITPAFKMAFLVALIPLISPFSWSYHHVMNLIPMAAVFIALWNLESPKVKDYFVLGGMVVISFILGTSDAAFVPFYLYSEIIRNGLPVPGIFRMPYIYMKAFFRDYRMLFVSNLVLWGVAGIMQIPEKES